MPDSSHTIREEIRGVLVFVGAIWAVYFLSYPFPALEHYGVIPRNADRPGGNPGHAVPPCTTSRHLISNTIPLVVLLILLAGSRAESWEVVVVIVLLGGLLLWIFGRSADHIGASGLISGLTAFLILSGFLEQRIIPFLVALLVGLSLRRLAHLRGDPSLRIEHLVGGAPLRGGGRRASWRWPWLRIRRKRSADSGSKHLHSRLGDCGFVLTKWTE